MSQQGGTGLGQVILNDLQKAGGWLENEASQFGLAAWNGVKALFQNIKAKTYLDLKALVQEASADENSGMGVEATVADVLTLAAQKGMSEVAQIPGEALTAAIALCRQELGLGKAKGTAAVSTSKITATKGVLSEAEARFISGRISGYLSDIATGKLSADAAAQSIITAGAAETPPLLQKIPIATVVDILHVGAETA
jgi:hypothetical protein